jgi:hypothetical protein
MTGSHDTTGQAQDSCSGPRAATHRGSGPELHTEGGIPMESIVTIVIVVLIVLFVLGYFGRGRFRA